MVIAVSSFGFRVRVARAAFAVSVIKAGFCPEILQVWDEARSLANEFWRRATEQDLSD